MFQVLKNILDVLLRILSFAWKEWDGRRSYLHIDLAIQLQNGTPTAKATVENKSPRAKQIDNALLLVGPEAESPIETYNRVIDDSGAPLERATCTNHIARQTIMEPLHGKDGRQIIPLPFFYADNVNIADERPSYTVPIDPQNVEPGVAYAARFFILGEGWLHRCTHDCFLLPAFARSGTGNMRACVPRPRKARAKRKRKRR